jgi:hypothetical protein
MKIRQEHMKTTIGTYVLIHGAWDTFMNDGDLDMAQRAYHVLNPHRLETLINRVSLETNPADLPIAESCMNCTEDTSLPDHLSRKLGLFRLIQVPGSHALCFSNPARLAEAVMSAGRD